LSSMTRMVMICICLPKTSGVSSQYNYSIKNKKKVD